MSDPLPPPSEEAPLLTVAIVGRPNVGKSTLFNRLVGSKIALVDDRPGVTRDRREGMGQVGPLKFKVIDTAGLDDQPDGSLEARMREQSERAVVEADVALFLIDARAGVTPLDREIAQDLRRGATPVVLVANKAEREGLPGMVEAYELGLGDPVPISAEHGEGLAGLYDLLAPFADAGAFDEEEDAAEEGDDAVKPLRLAIVGRPNVGKSTLINRLLGEERLLTGPEAGITRDAISIDWSWGGRPVRLIDTAGMRRKAKVEEKLESLSVADTLRAIRFAEGVVLVLDATQMLEKQDLAIARLVEDEGRALIIAVNKWDLIEDRAAALQQLKDRLQTSLPQLSGLVFVTVSAATNRGLDGMMKAVFDTHEVWNRRISTPRLNRWLESIQERHPPPLVAGRRLKLRYMTQANTRPPTFALFSSKPGDLPDAYRRYLVNTLREEFELPGVPVRMMLRKSVNPYADKD